ncbi:MAG TPA: ferric reductase-like transmembrane domain-containing protein [Thermoleophilaceae bacterium]
MGPRRAAYVLAGIVLFPLLPWLTAGSVEDRFSGDASLKSVANLAALFGLAAWAVTLVLASRIRPVERAVGGVENLYPVHRRMGELVAILAATHVVFLTLHEGSSVSDLYLPDAGLSVFTGVIAFVLLIGFVVASVTRRLGYQRFLLLQRLLGVTFLVGAFHSFAVRGTMASSLGLTIYLGCLTAAGIACLGYRLVGGRLGVGRHDYRVEDVRRLDDDVVEITLAPVGRPMEFRAGQFLYATFHQSRLPLESHPFSISSAPGRFCLSPDGVHSQTWIAGGIGITPFLSWARSLNEPIAADLYYCTPGAEHAHFLDELFDIADRYPTFRVIPIRKTSLGHLRVSDIEGVNPNVSHGHIFMCGPPTMVENLTTGFVTRGVSPSRIHAETFDFRG